MAIMSPDVCACPIQEVGPSMAGSCEGSQIILFMTILERFIFGRCDLADPCNRVRSRSPLDDSYDFVVAGGGPGGAAVAARLSENPQWKVLLIEAGGDEPTPSSVPAWVTAYWFNNETDWLYYTEPQERACLASEGKCYWSRAKMLGGCSVTNGMMYMRGHAADFDGWAASGAKGWSWGDVFPYFLKAEDNKQIGKLVSAQHHNRGGPIPVQQFPHAPRFAHDVVSAAIELGFPPTTDLNGDTITGFTIAQTMNNNGSRFSMARAYLRPASHRENLHVLLNAHVSRVVVHPLDKKVTAVEYIKDGETRTVGVKKEAIISAGALNSPQILLLSGIGPQETLDKFNIPTIKALPGVGQNLHNHVGVDLAFTLTKEKEVPELNWETAMEYMLKREGPMSSTGMSQVTGIANSRFAPTSGRHPDVQYFFRGYHASCGHADLTGPEEVEDGRYIGISVVNLQPKSRGYVSLRSVDPLQPPVMQPNYFLDERDIDVLVDAAKTAYRLANTTILREKYGMIPAPGHGAAECGEGGDNPTDEFLKCLTMQHTAPENHQVGTCKIGAESDPMAVVDHELKVYGIQGLRVADASVMPTVVTGNTASTTVMIGERAAEFIVTRYQRSKNQPGAFGNRFGEDASGNYASNENSDKHHHSVCIEKIILRKLTPAEIFQGWDFNGDESSETKDDKLTDYPATKPNRWQNWKPWDKTWHNQQFEQKPYDYGGWQKNVPQRNQRYSNR